MLSNVVKKLVRVWWKSTRGNENVPRNVYVLLEREKTRACEMKIYSREWKMFREMLTFRETSRKILDIYVSAALVYI